MGEFVEVVLVTGKEKKALRVRRGYRSCRPWLKPALKWSCPVAARDLRRLPGIDEGGTSPAYPGRRSFSQPNAGAGLAPGLPDLAAGGYRSLPAGQGEPAGYPVQPGFEKGWKKPGRSRSGPGDHHFSSDLGRSGERPAAGDGYRFEPPDGGGEPT